MIKKTLNIELYGDYKLHLILSNNVCKTRSKYNKQIGHKLIHDKTTTGIHSYNEDKEYESYIFLKYNTELSTIAHEALHATIRIMNYIGAQLNDGSEESYAYLMSYIIDQIVKLDKK